MCEGKGKFKATSEPLTASGNPLFLRADQHSDPCVVDWDGDGDLDILSGSASGSVWWAENQAGAGKKPMLKNFVKLIPGTKLGNVKPTFKKQPPEQPAQGTRIWVDDINGDGKLDILMGDNTSIAYATKGIDKETFKKKCSDLDRDIAIIDNQINLNPKTRTDKKLLARRRELFRIRRSFLTEEQTGFIWVFLRK